MKEIAAANMFESEYVPVLAVWYCLNAVNYKVNGLKCTRAHVFYDYVYITDRCMCIGVCVSTFFCSVT